MGEQLLANLKWGQLPAGQQINKVEAVFPRLDRKAAVTELRHLEEALQKEEALVPEKPAPGVQDEAAQPAAPSAAAAPASNPRIGLDDFLKVDMRVGTVRTAERVKGTQKLLKLTVDIGTEVRQVVAGIAEQYPPESLLDRRVVLVANLAPRKLRGIESNGMVLAAVVGEAGTPTLVSVPDDVPNGSRLR